MSFIIRIIQNYVRRYSINGLNKNKIVFSLLSCLSPRWRVHRLRCQPLTDLPQCNIVRRIIYELSSSKNGLGTLFIFGSDSSKLVFTNPHLIHT